MCSKYSFRCIALNANGLDKWPFSSALHLAHTQHHSYIQFFVRINRKSGYPFWEIETKNSIFFRLTRRLNLIENVIDLCSSRIAHVYILISISFDLSPEWLGWMRYIDFNHKQWMYYYFNKRNKLGEGACDATQSHRVKIHGFLLLVIRVPWNGVWEITITSSMKS